MMYHLCIGLQLLVWFYAISTILGYLMPNPLYTYKQYSLAQVQFLFTHNKMWKQFYLKQFSLT